MGTKAPPARHIHHREHYARCVIIIADCHLIYVEWCPIVHELGVTQSLLDISLYHARQAGAVRVRSLNLVIGELSSIVDDSVQFYWDMISQGTIAHGAKLCFRRVPAALRCDACGHEFPLGQRDFVCPACGSTSVSVQGGDEFFLESIDVDLASEAPPTPSPTG